MERNVWRKSTKSAGGTGQCVEVMITEDSVKVRDTKQEGRGPIHTFTHGEWAAFLDGAKQGEFDL
jgi:Domain of unknown function (DUF397)